MRSRKLPPFVRLSREVAAALREGRPVVALESAVISHGLPEPAGREAAAALEDEVRGEGAVPATVALSRGHLLVGADGRALEALTGPGAWKVAERDIGPAVAAGGTGGTTVSATIAAASLVGIEVMSTGGIGGVHLGADRTWDVSADLMALARHSVIVVCAGVKSICDVQKTLEYLDTAGVTVVGYGTDRFPGFYAVDGGANSPRRIDRPAEAAAVFAAKRLLGQRSALLVARPIPAGEALSETAVQHAVRDALARVGEVQAGDLTPALLSALGEITGNRTLRANVALLRANARLAAQIAKDAAQESLLR